MELSVTQRERLKELVEEVKAVFCESSSLDGRPKTFSELEEECIRAGDWLTAAVLEARVAARMSLKTVPCCPRCHREGEQEPDEPRVLQTDRGEVSWLEPAYHCRHCRRSFFPSVR